MCMYTPKSKLIKHLDKAHSWDAEVDVNTVRLLDIKARQRQTHVA